jgi:hypothetical protein
MSSDYLTYVMNLQLSHCSERKIYYDSPKTPEWRLQFEVLYIYSYLIEIITVGPILVKFGIGIYFDGGKVLSMVLTLYPDPRVRGALKQGMGCIYSLNCEARQNFYKTKVVRKDHFSGGRSYFWDPNLDLEGPGPHVLLEPWSVIFRQSLLQKSCSMPSQ